MDEYFTVSEDGCLDESVGEPIVFFDIFFGVVVQIDVQILKVFGSLGVLFTCDIQNMRDSHFEESPGLES